MGHDVDQAHELNLDASYSTGDAAMSQLDQNTVIYLAVSNINMSVRL